LSELITKYDASNQYLIAEVYAFRNQSDEAFEWLDRAYGQRNAGLILMKVDPLLKNLRHDSRYVALLKKLNSRPEICCSKLGSRTPKVRKPSR